MEDSNGSGLELNANFWDGTNNFLYLLLHWPEVHLDCVWFSYVVGSHKTIPFPCARYPLFWVKTRSWPLSGTDTPTTRAPDWLEEERIITDRNKERQKDKRRHTHTTWPTVHSRKVLFRGKIVQEGFLFGLKNEKCHKVWVNRIYLSINKREID